MLPLLFSELLLLSGPFSSPIPPPLSWLPAPQFSYWFPLQWFWLLVLSDDPRQFFFSQSRPVFQPQILSPSPSFSFSNAPYWSLNHYYQKNISCVFFLFSSFCLSFFDFFSLLLLGSGLVELSLPMILL